MKKDSNNLTNEKYPYSKIGKRLKKEAKKHGCSNQAIADLIGYSDGHQISDYYSGKKLLSEDRIDILCNTWGLRKEYLLCIDDWRTQIDMLKYSAIKDRDSFDKAIKYLSTLGLELKPTVTSRIHLKHIHKHWQQLQDYLTSDTIDNIKAQYSFFEPYSAFDDTFYNRIEYIEWKTPIDDFEYTFDIGKTSKQSDSFYLKAIDSKMGINISYELRYKIMRDGRLLYGKSESEMQLFIQQLDALATCAINDILPYVRTSFLGL